MSAEAARELVRRFYEEVVSSGRTERTAEFVSADCVETDGRVRVESGVEGMAEHVRAVREVWEGLTITVERQIAEGEWVVTCATARGVHRGHWAGIAPTGKELAFFTVNVDRVRGGRIVEHGGAADMMGPLLEAGALSPGSDPAAAAADAGPERFLGAYEAALATQDWDRVAPLMHDDVCVTFSDGACHRGKEAVGTAFRRNFALIEDERYRISDVHWIARGGSHAVCQYAYRWSGRIDGKPAAGTGRGTAVLERHGGSWRLVAEHLGPGGG